MVGIEKGRPFNPDARMKAILTDAANMGAVTARALALDIRGRDAFFYPDSKSNWRLPFFGGYTFQSRPGLSNLDGDGLVDIYFGPKAPKGMESNWVETIPGKVWFKILRLYGPLQPWFAAAKDPNHHSPRHEQFCSGYF